MKAIHLAASLIAFSLCAAPALAHDKSADKAPDVKEALDEWVQAVESGSADAVVKLYDKDAIMISTFVQHPMTTHAQIFSYYKKAEANPDINVEVSDQHPRRIGADTAVNTGEYTLTYTQEGEEVTTPARFSFTYKLEGGKWMIVDHHSSRVPQAEEGK